MKILIFHFLFMIIDTIIEITWVARKVNSRSTDKIKFLYSYSTTFLEFCCYCAYKKCRKQNQILIGWKQDLQVMKGFIHFSYFLLEPLLRIGFRQPVFKSNSGLFPSSVCNVIPWSSKNNIKVHSINTNVGIIFYTKIDMFLNTKPKVTSLGEISPP